MSPKRIAAIGELVWDLLPQGPQLGGAPANFAAMTANLTTCASWNRSDQAFLISRVGDDALGKRALQQLSRHGVDVDSISVDPTHSTGTVAIVMLPGADPVYRIEENVAWDYLEESPQLYALASSLDAVCFGTLAQRSPATRHTLRSLVESTRQECLRVFDVNLREPYWTPEAVAWGCAHAAIVKMNCREMDQIMASLSAPVSGAGPESFARFLLDRFPVEMVAITRGDAGSLLVTRKSVHEHPGVATKVKDPIGAGDAFTAALTLHVLRGRPLPMLAEAANRWGAWVVSQRGGMPSPNETTRRELEDAIEGGIVHDNNLPRKRFPHGTVDIVVMRTRVS